MDKSSCLFCEYHHVELILIRSGQIPLQRHECEHPCWLKEFSGKRVIGESDRTPSWCPLIPGAIEAGDRNKLITEEWLKSKGFRLVGERGDTRTRAEVRLRRLAICGKGGTENIFSSPDDLCIDIAPNPHSGGWYVWLHQEEPYRFIHIRNFQFKSDLERLYEALTGITME